MSVAYIQFQIVVVVVDGRPYASQPATSAIFPLMLFVQRGIVVTVFQWGHHPVVIAISSLRLVGQLAMVNIWLTQQWYQRH